MARHLSGGAHDDETALNDLNDTLNMDAKNKLIVLVKKYMEILNIAIQDTTPKYIIMVLVRNVSTSYLPTLVFLTVG